jgi:hypothetical protein
MIVHGWKDIENRDWPTRFRGRILVHASGTMTLIEYAEACAVARQIRGNLDGLLPARAIQRGGIIGSVEIVDCVTESDSDWFFGRYGFVLRAPEVLPFRPFKGRLGFFGVPMGA